MTTRSPSRTRATPGPVACTRPTSSWPITRGYATRLAPDVAANALSRLSADGLVQLETEPESEQLNVTVMLAPPLEEYGITRGEAP